jgi:uncharacterized phage-like protein YoqJ
MDNHADWTPEARALWSTSLPEMDRDILVGTGHRPQTLGLHHGPQTNRLLTEFARKHLEQVPRPQVVLTGGALGWDLALSHAAILFGIPLWVAIPHAGYTERWPEPARKRFWAILDRAKKVVQVCTGGYSHGKPLSRNRFMVDIGTRVLALCNGTGEGGTAQCVEYARRVGRPVLNLWEDWEIFRQSADATGR